MRLLSTSTLHFKEFGEPVTEPYAILSYIWGDEAHSLESIVRFWQESQPGHDLLKRFCEQAKHDGLAWAWIDPYCIDTNDLTEVKEAVNSQYMWFERAQICYTYLRDVPASDSAEDRIKSLLLSKYFTRKWTLQELIAPRTVIFFASDWERIGTRNSLQAVLSKLTGILVAVLSGVRKLKECDDCTLFAWRATLLNNGHRGLLANSPDEFLDHRHDLSRLTIYQQKNGTLTRPPTMTSKGVLAGFPLWHNPAGRDSRRYLAWICSTEKYMICIWLQSVPSRPHTYVRARPQDWVVYDLKEALNFENKQVYVIAHGAVDDISHGEADKETSGMIIVHVPESYKPQLTSYQSRQHVRSAVDKAIHVKWDDVTVRK